jgi:hypothetical protein
MQNNIATLYISKIHCCIVKYFCHFIQKKFFFNLKITVFAQREPAFSVGQFLILHVKSMFGKYRRGVAAQSTTYRGLTSAGKP